ncbi:MAG: PHP domain-containing protein, partial [Candidatus Binatia bacterium]
MSDYRELRCQSAFSFLRASSLPEDLVAEAARLDHGTLALGDRDGVYGAPRFFRDARRAGIRPLVGAHLSMADGTTLYVLVESRAGYRNLCKLVTRAKLGGSPSPWPSPQEERERLRKGEGRVAWSDLERHAEGLLCLAGGDGGPVSGALGRLRSIFPGRVWIDLQRHLDPDEERRNRFLLDLAAAERVPVVATNDVRHATRQARPLLDVFTCIREKTTLDTAGRMLLRNAERHLKSGREMERLFRDLPGAIRETRAVAERCEFTLADLGYRFPDLPLEPGESADQRLRALADEGARRRYGTITPRIRSQLEHELAIIEKLRLAGYFLIVWDIMEFCRREKILAQGRGSAANSAVCYALGITAVDAVGMDLLFERFLSEERGEWPDIDIDLPSGDRRERVIQYVYERYGRHGAGMTANLITYRVRSAVREIGKALGFAPAEIDRLSGCLRNHGYVDDQDRLAPQLRRAGLDPEAPRVRHLVRLASEIEGLPRHLGQHSGGMVIAAGRLDE